MHLKLNKTPEPFEESSIVTSLLSRQDEVIAELDGLDRQILSVISEIAAERGQPESESESESDSDIQPDVRSAKAA